MRQPGSGSVLCLLVILTYRIHSTCGWYWRCNNKNCERYGLPDDKRPEDSLEVCRLTCGDYGVLWPLPTGHVAIGKNVHSFNPTAVEFDTSSVADYDSYNVRLLVSRVTRRFVDNLSQMCGNCSNPYPEASVTVQIITTSGDLEQNWDTDESYAIEIQTKSNSFRVTVQIQAETVYGARHGLETLSQLITHVSGNSNLHIVTYAKVSDKPAFPHRGLLVDTSRHYLPLHVLERTIDAMATCKLNVLHWHITDSQSFPLQLSRVPQLARFGAYSADAVYTVSGDLASLAVYAKIRGVRILLELDMPAHAGNGWQWGEASDLGPLAVCVNQQPWRQYCLQPPCGQLNPANPNLYKILKVVFQEIINGLNIDAFHMGGDEVFLPCWKQSKEVTDWMKSQGKGLSNSDFIDVWGEFHKKVLEIWDEEMGNTKTPIVLWTSHLTDTNIIDKYLDKNRFVIEAWTDSTDPLVDHLLDMGYRVIIATKDAWYLDHGFWGKTLYHNWRRAYENRIPRRQGVLGGEVAMWGELVDENNLDARVWPRAAAAAERLWSDPQTDSSAAESRLIELRERLVRRGVQAEAITPQWCALNQGTCSGSVNTS